MKTPAQRRRSNIDFKKRAQRVIKASVNLLQERWGRLGGHKHSTTSIHTYEIRPRANKHGFDLSSDALRYSPLWCRGPNAIMDAVRYARSSSRPHPVAIRVYDPAGNIIEMLDYEGDFKEPKIPTAN